MAQTLRLYVDSALAAGAEIALPDGAARHAQVWRLQPGEGLWLFNGQGGQWRASVVHMGRREVTVRVEAHEASHTEPSRRVTLALGVPANERMDTLVEKATELGVAAIQPLLCARSVVRLAGERADKRRAHWQAVAQAAAEQSGRTAVPSIAPLAAFEAWLSAADGTSGVVLSLSPDARPLRERVQAAGAAPAFTLLSGPEGGLAPDEETRARRAGFSPAHLGPRVLRADTAPLAALALIQLLD